MREETGGPGVRQEGWVGIRRTKPGSFEEMNHFHGEQELIHQEFLSLLTVWTWLCLLAEVSATVFLPLCAPSISCA